MARSIEEIQNQILTAKENENALQELNSTSKTAIWRLWVFIVSVAIFTLEKLMDIHTSEVDAKLLELKPHTARWYRNKALAFQYGFDLLEDTDRYDNSNHTPEEISASKVVKYSAVVESEDGRRLIIKITGEENGKLSQISENVAEAFRFYINEIKDAGVPITVINYLPDLLKLSIRIVRDPLVLNENGMEILTGKYPVNDAIQSYMKELPFNGKLSLQALTDKLQRANGVKDLSIDLASTKWIDGSSSSYGDWKTINISRIPESGYFAVNLTENDETKSTITYV